jgi:uncharacterized ubiquitin-like protein YukD
MLEKNIVRLRVQVIDVRSFSLDLQISTYLPGKDVSQRLAQDAGLDAYWPDKSRRRYWLRARGRVVGDDEKLSDLGVTDGELVYLLPQPPPQSGVYEPSPEYPVVRGYAGGGYLVLFGSFAGSTAWAFAWGVAIFHDRSMPTVLLPGFAMGLLCTTLARHLWRGLGSRVRIPATALALQIMLSSFALLTPVLWQVWMQDIEVDPRMLTASTLPGIIAGMLGVLTGWLAWWGAVEPLPPVEFRPPEEVKVVGAVNCGICARPVDVSVRSECVHGCGQVFHTGCYQAKKAIYRGEGGQCVVCGRATG